MRLIWGSLAYIWKFQYCINVCKYRGYVICFSFCMCLPILSVIIFFVMEPSTVDYNWGKFPHSKWSGFYSDVQEVTTHDASPPRGGYMQQTCFLDSKHAGNPVTSISHTGIIIHVNKDQIIWCSERNNTVEVSTFGSEFIPQNTETELITSMG